MTNCYSVFRAAVERHDPDAAVALFAPDAVFHSPVVHKPYVGRDALRAILVAVDTVFEDFHYTGSYGSAYGHVFAFGARVGDRELEGVLMLSRG